MVQLLILREHIDHVHQIVLQIYFQLSAEKKRSDKKREALDISGCNPQLGGQIRAISLKDTHAFIGEGVEQVQTTDEQISDADEQEIRIFQETTRVPCKHENAACDDDTEYFSKTVEEEVTVKAGQVKSEQK